MIQHVRERYVIPQVRERFVIPYVRERYVIPHVKERNYHRQEKTGVEIGKIINTY